LDIVKKYSPARKGILTRKTLQTIAEWEGAEEVKRYNAAFAQYAADYAALEKAGGKWS
jgi:hypothetical protein